MNDSNNLKIVRLLHDISQLDYNIQFCGDFVGMIRMEIRKEYEPDYYEHRHLGFPDCSVEKLSEQVVEALEDFQKELFNGVRNSSK